MVRSETEMPPGAAADSETLTGAVFDDIGEAEAAVQKLQAAGYAREDVTVITSDVEKQRYFRRFAHESPAVRRTPKAAMSGAIIGALTAGVAAAFGGLANFEGGAIFLFLGAVATGAIAGGLIGRNKGVRNRCLSQIARWRTPTPLCKAMAGQ